MNEEEKKLEYEVSSDNIFKDLGLEKAEKMNDKCLFCQSILYKFSSGPLVKFEEKKYNCCENCANEKFPGWLEEEEFNFGNGPPIKKKNA